MKAIVYEAFGALPQLKNVSVPTPEAHGVIVKVMATGVCRSDWHDWDGHDADAGAGGNPATPGKVSHVRGYG